MPPERFELRLEQATLARIDQWRAQSPDTPTRAAAIRQLVETALQAEQDERLFQLMRFQVLARGKQLLPDAISAEAEAYLYAWSARVYPIFEQAHDFHLPYAKHFHVSRDMMGELADALHNEAPTFYGLEGLLRVSDGYRGWDRVLLMQACRYLWLASSRTRTPQWERLIAWGEHPIEARDLLFAFNAKKEIPLA